MGAMNGPLEWIAAIGTMIAAAMIAADLGRKVTGWGFVLFCAVAVTWIASGLSSGAMPIAAMNAILLLIPGVAEGITGMRPGGVRKLVIPPQLAWVNGNGDIPPITTIVYEIELLWVEPR